MEKLIKMEEVAYNELSILFNSDGSVLTRKEMKPFVRRTVLNKLLFSIRWAEQNNVPCLDLIELKEILMSQK